MLSKDFENYELRIKKLSEERSEFFLRSEKIFQENFLTSLENLFPDDILGVKKNIRILFLLHITHALESGKDFDIQDVFQKSIATSCNDLAVPDDMKRILFQSLTTLTQHGSLNAQNVLQHSIIQRDPLYPILEDIFSDGKISGEELLLLQQHYNGQTSFQKTLEYISPESKQKVIGELGELSHTSLLQRKELFESEYSEPLEHLKARGYQVQAVIPFVSLNYYKPAKRFEHDKKRLKRTWKISFLKLLGIRFGSFNIEDILKQFEDCESFEDFFLLFYKLFEILSEDNEAQTSYQLQEEENIVANIIETAAIRKEKILKGEKTTANITQVISETDGQLESGILEKILEEGTHFIGDEIHFGHIGEMDGIYADSQEDESEEDEESKIHSGDTLQGNYDRLKEYFLELDNQKRKAFGSGDYDLIDEINDKLFRVESQLLKISQLLYKEGV